MKKTRTKQLVMAALTTAIIAVLSQISLPLPFGVPITLQTFAVALCGFLLGTKWASLSISAYILLGAVGVPVFAGFKAGGGVLVGLTGGFIFGFLALGALCGIRCKKQWLSILLAFAGLAVDYAMGIVQFMLVNQAPLYKAMLLITMPIFLKDVVSVLLAYLITQKIKSRLL